MNSAPYQAEISHFADLELSEKVRRLAEAAVAFEQKLEKREQSLGHPGDRPFDYLAGVGAEMLGVLPGYCNNRDAVFSCPFPEADILRRCGLKISETEARYLQGDNGLVFATDAIKNNFIAFIGGRELNKTNPHGIIYSDFLRFRCVLAKMLEVFRCYNKVFGSFSFVNARSADLKRFESEYTLLPSYSKQEFRYATYDIACYAGGIEFSSLGTPDAKERIYASQVDPLTSATADPPRAYSARLPSRPSSAAAARASAARARASRSCGGA
jgi:hypothetical protein